MSRPSGSRTPPLRPLACARARCCLSCSPGSFCGRPHRSGGVACEFELAATRNGAAMVSVGSRVQSYSADVYPMMAKLQPHTGQSMKTGSSLTAMRRLFVEMSDECVVYTCLCRAYRRSGLYRSVVGSCRSRVVRPCDHRSVLGCWTLRPMKNLAIWPGVTSVRPRRHRGKEPVASLVNVTTWRRLRVAGAIICGNLLAADNPGCLHSRPSHAGCRTPIVAG
jgi:hypothetical protein